jgi:hypothetical protein
MCVLWPPARLIPCSWFLFYALRWRMVLPWLKYHCCLVYNHSMDEVFWCCQFIKCLSNMQENQEQSSAVLSERAFIRLIPKSVCRKRRWRNGVYSRTKSLFVSYKDSKVIRSQVKGYGKKSILTSLLYLHLYCPENIFWIKRFPELVRIFSMSLLGDRV